MHVLLFEILPKWTDNYNYKSVFQICCSPQGQSITIREKQQQKKVWQYKWRYRTFADILAVSLLEVRSLFPWYRNSNRSLLNQSKHVWRERAEAGQQLGDQCSHSFFLQSTVFFSLHFRSDPVLLVAAERSEHFKSWWQLTGFYGVLWSCRLQLWGEDSLSFPAASFVWSLGIVKRDEEKSWF